MYSLMNFSLSAHLCHQGPKARNGPFHRPEVSLIMTPFLTTRSNSGLTHTRHFLALKTIISPLTRIPKHCSLVLPLFWTFNKENPIVCILQCLTSFAQHRSWNSGIFVAGICRWFTFIAVYDSIEWLALFLCAFSCWWPFGLFTVWDGCQKMLLWSLSDVPLGKLMCVLVPMSPCFLLGTPGGGIIASHSVFTAALSAQRDGWLSSASVGSLLSVLPLYPLGCLWAPPGATSPFQVLWELES